MRLAGSLPPITLMDGARRHLSLAHTRAHAHVSPQHTHFLFLQPHKEEMPAPFLNLSQPPQGLSAAPAFPLRPCQGCGPGPPGGPPVGPVTQGSVRRGQDVSAIHWATRNLTLLFIGSATAGPAWQEAATTAGELGPGAVSPEQDAARLCHPPPPASGGPGLD